MAEHESPAAKARRIWPTKMQAEFAALRSRRQAYQTVDTDSPTRYNNGEPNGTDVPNEGDKTMKDNLLTTDGEALDAAETDELKALAGVGVNPPVGRSATFPDGLSAFPADLPQPAPKTVANPAPYPEGYKPPAKTADPTPEQMYQRERLLADSDGERRAKEAQVVKGRNAPTNEQADRLRARQAEISETLATLDKLFNEQERALQLAEAMFNETRLLRGNLRTELSDLARRLVAAERN